MQTAETQLATGHVSSSFSTVSPAELYQSARGAGPHAAWGDGIVPHAFGELPNPFVADDPEDASRRFATDAPEDACDFLSTLPTDAEMAAVCPPPKTPTLQDLDRYVEDGSGSGSEHVSDAEMEDAAPRPASFPSSSTITTTTTAAALRGGPGASSSGPSVAKRHEEAGRPPRRSAEPISHASSGSSTPNPPPPPAAPAEAEIRLPPRKRVRVASEAHDLVTYTREFRMDKLKARWVARNGTLGDDLERRQEAMRWAEAELAKEDAEIGMHDEYLPPSIGKRKRERKRPPRFLPLDGRTEPLEKPSKADEVSSGGSSSSDGGSDDDDGNEDTCRVCREQGQLVCCDTCPRAYHLECLSSPIAALESGPTGEEEDEEESEWMCPECVKRQQEDEEFEPDEGLVAAEEEADAEARAAWAEEVDNQKSLEEKDFEEFVARVDSLVDAEETDDPVGLLANMDRVLLSRYLQQVRKETAALGLPSSRATDMIEAALAIDDAEDEGGIDLSKDPVDEACAAMERCIASRCDADADMSKVMRSLLEAARDGEDLHFTKRIALLEALMAGQGFFREDRRELASFIRATFATHTAFKIFALKVLAGCPKFRHYSSRTSSSSSNKKKRGNRKNGSASEETNGSPKKTMHSSSSSDSEPETPRAKKNGTEEQQPSIDPVALMKKLPKPSAVFPTRMIKKRLHGQAQRDGSCDFGLPPAADALLLSKGHSMHYNPSDRKAPWPNTTSNTIGKVVREYIDDQCVGDADKFVLKYVTWGLARIGKTDTAPVWVYAFLRLRNAPPTHQGSTLIPIPSGSLPKIFPTAKRVSLTISGLYKDARSRVTKGYDPESGTFSWYGDWANMRKAKYVREVRQGKDECATETTQLPVIDSRRLTDLLKLAVKTLAEAGGAPPKTAPSSTDVYSDLDSDSDSGAEEPRKKRPKSKAKRVKKKKPARKPPADDPLLAEKGQVSSFEAAFFAKAAAIAGMRSVASPQDLGPEWVPASQACDDSAILALCPPAPKPKANGVAPPAGPTDAATKPKGKGKKRARETSKAGKAAQPSPRAKKAKAAGSKAGKTAGSSKKAKTAGSKAAKRKAPEASPKAKQKGWTKRKKPKTAVSGKAREALAEFKRVVAQASGPPPWFAETPMAERIQGFADQGADPDPLAALLQACEKDKLDELVLAGLDREGIEAMTKVLKAAAGGPTHKLAADALYRFANPLGRTVLLETVFSLSLLALRLHRPQSLDAAGDFASDQQRGMDDFDLDAALFGSDEDDEPSDSCRPFAPTPLACVMLHTAHQKFRIKGTKEPKDPRDVVDQIETTGLSWLLKEMTAAEGDSAAFADSLIARAGTGSPIPSILALGWYAMVPSSKP